MPCHHHEPPHPPSTQLIKPSTFYSAKYAPMILPTKPGHRSAREPRAVDAAAALRATAHYPATPQVHFAVLLHRRHRLSRLHLHSCRQLSLLRLFVSHHPSMISAPKTWANERKSLLTGCLLITACALSAGLAASMGGWSLGSWAVGIFCCYA